MKYYKVKPEYDNTALHKHDKRYSDNLRMYAGFLIGNELFTEKELERMKKDGICDLWDRKFTIVEIPKSRVYFMFGARFESKD
jgi:hypothetical protein